MVDDGHVANVLTWRLDRLSRNLGDLIMLADRFGQANVALHSFTQKIDLSSATGRMFYNILGSFAQFFREQLAENVRMGMQQAVRQGKWVNRPKRATTSLTASSFPSDGTCRPADLHHAGAGRVRARSLRRRASSTRPAAAFWDLVSISARSRSTANGSPDITKRSSRRQPSPPPTGAG